MNKGRWSVFIPPWQVKKKLVEQDTHMIYLVWCLYSGTVPAIGKVSISNNKHLMMFIEKMHFFRICKCMKTVLFDG